MTGFLSTKRREVSPFSQTEQAMTFLWSLRCHCFPPPLFFQYLQTNIGCSDIFTYISDLNFSVVFTVSSTFGDLFTLSMPFFICTDLTSSVLQRIPCPDTRGLILLSKWREQLEFFRSLFEQHLSFCFRACLQDEVSRLRTRPEISSGICSILRPSQFCCPSYVNSIFRILGFTSWMQPWRLLTTIFFIPWRKETILFARTWSASFAISLVVKQKLLSQ